MKYICSKVSMSNIDECDHAKPHDYLRKSDDGNDCVGPCCYKGHVECVEIKDVNTSSRKDTKNIIQNMFETMQSMQKAFSEAGGTWENKDFSQTTVAELIATMSRNDIRFCYVGEKSD